MFVLCALLPAIGEPSFAQTPRAAPSARLAQKPATPPPANAAATASQEAATANGAAATPNGAAAATPGAANGPPVYYIEMIVFRASSALGTPEDWNSETARGGLTPPTDSDAAPPAPAGVATPAPPPAPPTAAAAATAAADATAASRSVHPLGESDFQLNEIESRLRASGTYVPVAHVAWSQTASPWGDHAGVPLQALGIDAPGLSGTVSLERGQFLHLGLALNLEMDKPPEGLGAAPGTIFVLRDMQRVRFYDRNYFDNPAFGAIALVTPALGARRAGR